MLHGLAREDRAGADDSTNNAAIFTNGSLCETRSQPAERSEVLQQHGALRLVAGLAGGRCAALQRALCEPALEALRDRHEDRGGEVHAPLLAALRSREGRLSEREGKRREARPGRARRKHHEVREHGHHVLLPVLLQAPAAGQAAGSGRGSLRGECWRREETEDAASHKLWRQPAQGVAGKRRTFALFPRSQQQEPHRRPGEAVTTQQPCEPREQCLY
mmetsp:Transcript_102406/g.285363  ORF Transcript_102406/g.285363 Transcript_102406/m.285363 type:complete len:218 (+) Transcript_102406:432-1085(+)